MTAHIGHPYGTKMTTATTALTNAVIAGPESITRRAALRTAKRYAAEAIYEADTDEQVELATAVLEFAAKLEREDADPSSRPLKTVP
jgi:hypothetical protein